MSCEEVNASRQMLSRHAKLPSRPMHISCVCVCVCVCVLGGGEVFEAIFSKLVMLKWSSLSVWVR